MEKFTIESVKSSVPVKLHTAITQELVDKINILDSNVPDMADVIKDNFITYVDVLSEGKYKLNDYLNAIQYVSFKLMGKTNRDAFSLVFPERFSRMKEKMIPDKDIDSMISAYNRNKLVNKIYEKTLIPSWILNQDAYQEAINTQVSLMRSASSDRVKAMAADSILTHLKRPDNITQAQLNINVNTGNTLDDIQRNLVNLAKTQQDLIKNNFASPKEIAEQRIIVDVESS